MKHKILIIVKGGLVQEIHGIPAETIIRVRDYDVDGQDEDRLTKDRDGELNCETVWTHEDSCGPANE